MAVCHYIALINLSDFICRSVELPIVYRRFSKFASSCLSVRPQGITGLPLDGFFNEMLYLSFSANFARTFKCNKNLTTITVLYMQTDIHV